MYEMTILVLRAVLLFLAIYFTGFAFTAVLACGALISSEHHKEQADNFGGVKYNYKFSGMWVWLLVALFWAGFFFVGWVCNI